jgi:hypothetical protein
MSSEYFPPPDTPMVGWPTPEKMYTQAELDKIEQELINEFKSYFERVKLECDGDVFIARKEDEYGYDFFRRDDPVKAIRDCIFQMIQERAK